MMAGLLDVSAVSRHYRNGVTALDEVSLSLGTGEFASIVGKSGSGKSTLLHILGGLDRPDSGSVSVRGVPLDFSSRKALVLHRRNTVGFIFQQFFLIPTLTAQENVEYPLIFQGTPRNERRARATRLLELVGLSARSSHHPTQLSGGEQQRVAVARALAGEPQLVLADEPTGNLDSGTGEEIIGLMRQINRERGISFLVVTHDPDLARHANTRIELQDGRIRE
jgi:ABC-type lipoprotein export system ATPase subunit